MRVWINFLVILVVLSGCRIDGGKNIGEEDLNFATTDDSELFFKNVRQLYYDLEEIQAAHLNVFRIKERSKEADYPLINLAIVWNWLEDEAYILIEPNEYLAEEDPIRINWLDKPSGEKGELIYQMGNNRTQLIFSTEVYNGLNKGYEFEVMVSGKAEKIFSNRKDREAFRKTMSDYFRLTRTFESRD